MQVIIAFDLVQTGYVKPDLPMVDFFLVQPAYASQKLAYQLWS
jgi:hypothetical protein